MKSQSQNRGKLAQTVLRDMADGRIFLGSDAVAAGLVNGINSLDAVVASLNAPTPGLTVSTGADPSRECSTMRDR